MPDTIVNFCAHPWTGLDVRPWWNIGPCCKYQAEKDYRDLDEYYSSKELAQLKQDFLDNKRPSGCAQCWMDEDAGLPSKRTIDYQYRYNDDFSNLVDLHVLNLPFGNTCNLACRTCGSHSSSKWLEEEKKLQPYLDVKLHPHHKFYKDEIFIDKIKHLSKNVKEVSFTGGEPFITGPKQQLDFLDHLLQCDPETISLTYITNTTTFPDEQFWQRWKKFKKITLLLSVDATHDRFEYIRWPAVWEDCYANIKKYQSKQSELVNLNLAISHTVSVFNVYYLPEFFVWCFKEKLPEPYIGMVETPAHFDIRVFPEHIKQQIAKKINLKKFHPAINFMNQPSQENFELCKKWIKTVDQQRNQNFSVTFPEIANLLKL